MLLTATLVLGLLSPAGAGGPRLRIGSNAAFRSVSLALKGQGHNVIWVEGSARVFEGTFSWRLRDGARLVASGTARSRVGQTWSAFAFRLGRLHIPKRGLTLILFEPSPRNGKPVYRLRGAIRP